MIKEKYLTIISIVTISLVLVFTAILSTSDKTAVSVSDSSSEYVQKIFQKDKVMDIDISVDTAKWEELLKNASDEKYIPADVSINGEIYSTVGMRAKGNSSLQMVASDDTTDRYSLKLDFAEYVNGQNLYGLQKLALNNMIGDSSYMKEVLSYDMMAEMGVKTPASAFASISINGEPWGLYLAVEILDEDYLKRYYGDDYGNLYKPEDTKNFKMPADGAPQDGVPPPANMPKEETSDAVTARMDVHDDGQAQNLAPAAASPENPGKQGGQMPQMKVTTNLMYTDDNISSYSGIFDNAVTKTTDESDYEIVIEMLKTLSTGENLEEHLDVDEILRYFAVNTFLVNLDSYASNMKHNYYLYEDDGIFEILPWDFNLAFGGFMLSEASEAINFPVDAPVTDTMENSPLISKLLEIDKYKEIYHGYLSELVDTYIESGSFENEVERIDKLISEYVKNDVTAFYDYPSYQKAVENIRIFGKDRAKSIKLQLEGSQPSETYGNMETALDLSVMGTQGGPGNNGGPGGNQGGPDDKRSKLDINTNANNPPGVNSPSVKNLPPEMPEEEVLEPSDFIALGLSLVSLLLASIFVKKYNRKKFKSK